FDAYVNVAGGLKIDEPACDLGIVTAIASSFRNVPVDINTVLIGEVGLTGEVRAVNQVDKRVMEAMRIGFKRCIVPLGNVEVIKNMKEVNNIDIVGVGNVQEPLGIALQ
ncbi:MAG TPA: DNA repair protein RadA, partial [Ruminiclostridium sp.]|nr:DNA repair protein RadA [Ruminiclostridium sp.]